MNDLMDFEQFIDYVYDDLYEYDAYPARRYLRDAINPLEYYDNEEFRKRFRFSKNTVVHVIFPLLFTSSNETNRGIPVPPMVQLFVALKFYATGLFQIDCGDLHKLSQGTVSKIVSKLSRQLAMKMSQYINFPASTEMSAIKMEFYQIAEFPGVVGCIDCTHVPINNPGRARGEIFRNRKTTFSLNVQIVYGPNLKIFDVVARWPGSVHDSRIFANSRCCMRFEEGNIRGILLGDSGYAQTHYMFTPIINPQTPAEQRYNRAHIQTRNTIERLNGVIKRRFACLSRKLQNTLKNIPNIIVACAVLHNISIMTNDLQDDLQQEEELEETMRDPAPINERGSLIRAAFINRHFSQ